MRYLSILALGLTVSAVSALAQGSIRFDTSVSGASPVNARVTDGGVGVSGAAGFGQLYVGTSANNLTAVGTARNFLSGAGAGYILAGTFALPTQAGFAGGSTVFVQLRAWESAYSTYEAAVLAGGKVGTSGAAISYVLGGAGDPPSTPAPLVGLSGFAIAPVPEPSTIALAGLGLGGLLLARRKKV